MNINTDELTIREISSILSSDSVSHLTLTVPGWDHELVMYDVIESHHMLEFFNRASSVQVIPRTKFVPVEGSVVYHLEYGKGVVRSVGVFSVSVMIKEKLHLFRHDEVILL